MSRMLTVRNPYTGENDYQFTATSIEQLEVMTQQLRVAQPHWQATGLAHRQQALGAFADALDHDRDELVSALAADTGRRRLAASEVDGVISSISRWSHAAPALLAPQTVDSAAMEHVTTVVDSQPYPLLGAISPWNFPLLLSFIDVIPALLAGCAAIIKPSEVTPRFVEPLQKILSRVPELTDVLTLAPGDGQTGAALIEQVDVVAFTGSVATGRKVASAAASQFIPAYLELGGKDPAIIMPGADLARAATSILRASVAATGQACQSLERIYVHESDAQAFLEQLTAVAQQVELTNANPRQGVVGPLIFSEQANVIADQLADATNQGAKIHCGGVVYENKGSFWIAPTVLSQVNHRMKVMQEETFGPLMPVMTYAEIDQAVALANDTIYGLSAAVFGPDDQAALAVGRRLSAGGISVNDAGLTTMLFETEKSAFGLSGMGPSRVGASGLTRFLRRQSFYVNSGPVLPLEIFAE